MHIKKYWTAFAEIAFTALNGVFWFADAIVYLFTAMVWQMNFPPYIYFIVLVIGFLVSAIKKVADKDSQVSESRVEVPILGLYLRRNQIRADETKPISVLRVRNLWTKPIKDIKISPVKLGGNLIVLEFKIDGTNILTIDEERDIIHDSKTNIGKYLVFPASFDPKYANTNYAMTISFKDAQNNKYKQIFNLGKNDIFIKQTKRLN